MHLRSQESLVRKDTGGGSTIACKHRVTNRGNFRTTLIFYDLPPFYARIMPSICLLFLVSSTVFSLCDRDNNSIQHKQLNYTVHMPRQIASTVTFFLSPLQGQSGFVQNVSTSARAKNDMASRNEKLHVCRG